MYTQIGCTLSDCSWDFCAGYDTGGGGGGGLQEEQVFVTRVRRQELSAKSRAEETVSLNQRKRTGRNNLTFLLSNLSLLPIHSFRKFNWKAADMVSGKCRL